MEQFISKEILDELSYTSTLGQSIKQISLSKTPNEARCLPGTLEAIRSDGVQIVVLDAPDIYPEYAPYEYVEDMKEYIDRVAKLNSSV